MSTRPFIFLFAALLLPVSALGQLPTAGLQIVTPATSTIVGPGDILRVKVERRMGVRPLLAVAIEGTLPIESPEQAIDMSEPYEFRLVIRHDARPGRYTIFAVGGDRRSPGVESESVVITLERTAPMPGTLVVDPPYTKLRYPGDSASPLPVELRGEQVLGIANMPGVEYTVADQSVARVENGVVQALRPGETTLDVSYGGQVQVVRIRVGGSLRGDFNDDGVVDRRDVSLLPIGSTPARRPVDARDLNNDGNLDERDRELLTTLCLRPVCAVR